MAINEQEKLTVPFANSGLRNEIPQTATGSNLASYEEGFPAVTMTAIASGGQPPTGQDFNGILNVITKILQYAQSGGLYKYDADYAEAVNGYPVGAILRSADGSKIWMNTTASNSSDPDNGGQNWVAITDASSLASALSNYLPKYGGTMSGQVTSTFNGAFIKQGADNSMVGILGGTSNSGGCGALWLYGKNSSEHTAGWVLRSSNGTNVSTLECNPSGVLKLNNNEVLTTASTLDASKLNVSYLPTAGGTMTGVITLGDSNSDLAKRNVNTKSISVHGGTGLNQGASIVVRGKDENSGSLAGTVLLRAHDGTNLKDLILYPNGNLVWGSKNILREDTLCTTKATTTNPASASKPCVVVQAYKNGINWYRKWSDGWIEQGGSASTGETVNLITPFTGTDYMLLITGALNATTGTTATVGYISGFSVPPAANRQTNKFIRVGDANGKNVHVMWYACGY